ncbi:ATP-binding cassette domain-containing protein [Azoarcus communis]|uniref:ABC transporter ATP-binding protein n=1 Tax=Parazoarcus communis SWub3 = DSM 12120 TaxID=1121029 RepID=A0A323UTI8_9RHOO|nr:ABC transporter ATP-binding protein [Parazoarcus communis]NMG50574.1 ATP-binding cassette domain-containing protein [Parazoarcus communis]NMG72083.1 ATP-binding cassette domain-containing protein [Parazoarcus communis SWub3 = DSM 12120]PZA14526.1 ABC transporter ATP-binding protein [Azoarcus communis] [Parazoarcus communis SWub3 = DSM 12120]
MSPTGKTLLEVDRLAVEFRTRSGTVRALEDVSLALAEGETVGLVGESGSGKSVLSFAAMGIQDPAARITAGSLRFAGQDLLAGKGAAMKALRGREMAMIFQNPRVALNPIRPVGKQIEDVLARHTDLHPAARRARAVECLAEVRIPDPERRYAAYPFELSGGMCQRVMIAIALACKPRLLIADEPTTGLDVTTQAAIMRLISELSAERRMATLLITHDLGLAREYCDRIAVMHAGHIVEVGPTAGLFAAPRHPYTERLIAATPVGANSLDELAAIDGNLPDLRRDDLPACRFAERCPQRAAVCDAPLALLPAEGSHRVACHLPRKVAHSLERKHVASA